MRPRTPRAAILAGETVPVKDFEKGIYFEGCLPIEVMAERGRETLRHGPLKPMGLPDPTTGTTGDVLSLNLAGVTFLFALAEVGAS